MVNAGASAVDIDMTPIRVRNASLVPRMMSALYALFNYEARGLEAYMRQNASWQDQTGNARSGLTARPFRTDVNVGIDLFHTVPYGIWLETRWSGKYAIIVPTINAQAPDVIAAAKDLLGRL
jgi:hypothetical protein